MSKDCIEGEVESSTRSYANRTSHIVDLKERGNTRRNDPVATGVHKITSPTSQLKQRRDPMSSLKKQGITRTLSVAALEATTKSAILLIMVMGILWSNVKVSALLFLGTNIHSMFLTTGTVEKQTEEAYLARWYGRDELQTMNMILPHASSMIWTIILAIFSFMIGILLWNNVDATPALWIYDGVTRLLGVSTTESSLAGQTIWIVGASSGIGAAVVRELAQLSSPPRHIILSAPERCAPEMYQIVDQECKRQESSRKKTTFSVVPYDALIAESTSSVVQKAIDSSPTKSIDILVQNSGIYQSQPALETSSEYRRKLFRINVEAPIELSQALILQNGWKERHRGHIVVVSSMMAKGPQSLSSTYAATKAALRSYFTSLSCEEWSWLKVTNILPGGTDTNLWQHAEDPKSQQIRPDKGTLMAPQRVAHLMVLAMAARHSNWPLAWLFFHEVWISKSLGLTYGFLSHYAPTLFYFSNHLVGLARVEAWKKYQRDMLELPALIQTTFKVLTHKKSV